MNSQTKLIGEKIGIDWEKAQFTVDDLSKGIQVELEHGTQDPQTNVTDNNLETTAKIAWAHLKEDPEYYKKLAKMEKSSELALYYQLGVKACLQKYAASVQNAASQLESYVRRHPADTEKILNEVVNLSQKRSRK